MTIEVLPRGIRCNLACTYCYQNPMRDAGNFGPAGMDWEKVRAALDQHGAHFSLFGGEALLTPKSDLEKIFSYGYENYGGNGIQTNGVLIDDDHIDIFKRYKVHVGFSFDGPGRLNDLRWAGTLEATREATEKTISNVERVTKAGLSAGAILTLHKVNVGTAERLEEFKSFLRWLDEIGLESIRLHDLEVDNDLTARKHQLSPERTTEVFLDLAELAKELGSLQVDVFTDILNLLKGDDTKATCTWKACDPYTTEAVQGIQADGTASNCGRTNKEGINWLKADREGYERNVVLYQTPHEYGGCKECRFWSLCKGQCPGEGVNGDWRNRSDSCPTWFALFEYFESKLLEIGITPISQHPKRKLIERYMLNSWLEGRNMGVTEALGYAEQTSSRITLPVL